MLPQHSEALPPCRCYVLEAQKPDDKGSGKKRKRDESKDEKVSTGSGLHLSLKPSRLTSKAEPTADLSPELGIPDLKAGLEVRQTATASMWLVEHHKKS